MKEIFVAVWQDRTGKVSLLHSAPESADIRQWIKDNFPGWIYGEQDDIWYNAKAETIKVMPVSIEGINQPL